MNSDEFAEALGGDKVIKKGMKVRCGGLFGTCTDVDVVHGNPMVQIGEYGYFAASIVTPVEGETT